MKHLLPLLLLLLPFPGGLLRAQEDGLDPATLVLEKYTPTHFDPHELLQVLTELHGRPLELADGRRISNLMVLGDDLLLYDTPERVQTMLHALEQLDPAEEASEDEEDITVLDPASAVLRTFLPRYADLEELLETVLSLEGRVVQIGENIRDNASILGRSIVVYEEPARAERILQILQELDDGAAMTGPDLEVLTYRPRHVPLATLAEAVQPFRRQVFEPAPAPQMPSSQATNISLVTEQGLLVVRDTPERLEAIQGLLEELDRPRPQGLLTCMVLHRTDSEEPEPPRAVAEALNRILPPARYGVIASGMLRTTLAAGGVAALELPASGGRFRLELEFGAWDAETGTLDLSRCSFAVREEPAVQDPRIPGGATSKEIFATATAVVAGEYAVVGAAGADPLLVVLQLQPVR